MDPRVVFGTETQHDKPFHVSRMFVGYKDAASVMRAANTWTVQTKYLNTYSVYSKTFYAAALHVTMTGIDVDFQKPKEQKHISFEG